MWYIAAQILEAAIAEMVLPQEYTLEIAIHSEMPAGASTGTSAAVTVALLGALDTLTPGRLTPHEIAYRAHRVEVERLGLQSGIQDQLCAAFGALNFIEMNEKELEFSLFQCVETAIEAVLNTSKSIVKFFLLPMLNSNLTLQFSNNFC